MPNYELLSPENWTPIPGEQFFSILLTGTPATNLFMSMLQFVLGTVIVAALAYFVTKKIAGAARGGLSKKGGNITIVESIPVGGYAMVQLVKAGEKYIVIGITREKVTFLTEIDKDEIIEPKPIEYGETPFSKIFSKFIKDGRNQGGNDEN